MSLILLIVCIAIAYVILGCVVGGVMMARKGWKPYNHDPYQVVDEWGGRTTSYHNECLNMFSAALFWPFVLASFIVAAIAVGMYKLVITGPGKLLTSIGYKLNPSLREGEL